MSDSLAISDSNAADGEAVAAKSGGVAAKDSGLALGGTGNQLLAAGAVNSQGIGNTLNVTDGGAFDLVKYIAGLNQSALTGAVQAVQDSAQSSTAAQSNILDKALESIAALQEEQQTDGTKNQNKTVVLIILMIAGVLGIFLWRKS